MNRLKYENQPTIVPVTGDYMAVTHGTFACGQREGGVASRAAHSSQVPQVLLMLEYLGVASY